MHTYLEHAQKNEVLEMGTKQFEELEFCQLEQESSLEEKKETQSSQLLQEQNEYHCSVALRKVWSKKSFSMIATKNDMRCLYTSSSSCPTALQDRMAALEAQVKQMGLQAAQDCERLARDRTLTLQLLQKVGPAC